MAYSAVCQAHSKSATSVCFTHGTFLCTKCLLEKVEEKQDCDKYDLTEIKDPEDQVKLMFLTMQQRALKKKETIHYRIKEVEKGREYLVQQVEEEREALIKIINDKANKSLTAINNEGNTIESKYNVMVNTIDEKLKLIETDIKRMASEDTDIANIRKSIEILEKELTQTYIVCGTVLADYETDKRLTGTFKLMDSLGTIVLRELEDYEPIGGVDNKAFAKDDGEKKDVRKTEGIDTKDSLLGSAIYEYEIRKSIVQPVKQSDTVEKEGNITISENKDEEKTPPPTPTISPLQSDDTTADKSKCCCN